MKSLQMFVVGVCVLVVCVAMASGQGVECNSTISALCPDIDTTPPMYIADPSDCAAYCECSGGTAWRFHCEIQLLFNDEINVCDWPSHVDCGSRPIIS